MPASQKTIFKRIIDKELPADIVHEDDYCVAFRDINPQAPTHVLIVPKQEIPSLDHISEVDEVLIGHLFAVASKLATQFGLDGGYRTVINCGKDAGQSVDHLHVHLLGGRAMSWPPG